MKVGMSTGAVWYFPVNRVLPLIKNAGFTYIEISGNRPHVPSDTKELKKLKNYIDSLGLIPITYHSPFINGIECSTAFSKNKREIDTAFRTCEILEIPLMVVHPSDIENNTKYRNRKIKNVYKNIEYIQKTAEKKKITVALETLLPHLLMGDFLDYYSLYEHFSSQYFQICFDTSHANLTRHLDTYFSLLHSHVKSIHLSDNHGKYDDHLIPGDGIINWKSFADTLSKHQYNGHIIIEINLYNEKDPKKLEKLLEFAKKQCEKYIKI